MSEPLHLNKVKFGNDFVKAVLSTDKNLTYRYFNNRRYYFNYTSDHNIVVEIILRVHLQKQYVAVIVNSKSKLKEISFNKEMSYYHDGFLNRKSFGEFAFESTHKDSYYTVAKSIQQSMVVSVEIHMYEILLSRKGIELAQNYEVENPNIPIVFPPFYSGLKDPMNSNNRLKKFYIYLFKALDMANADIIQYRIPYILMSIIQVALDQKKIPSENRIHRF